MAKPFAASKNVKLLGSQLSCCSFDDVLCAMAEAIEKRRCGYISITNTESIYHALRIPEHQAYINGADFSCCDGVAAVLAGKMLGMDIPRLHGPDLMEKCIAYGVDKNWRHFFYGGKSDVPKLLGANFTAKYPGMITAGVYSPPFRDLTPEEDQNIIAAINKADPDVIWVGLGLLKQEQWISRHRKKLNARWMIGVGAAFDFHTGTVKRAPKIFRDLGMEWLYRVAFEPRMIKRNFYSALIFPQVFRETIKNLNHRE